MPSATETLILDTHVWVDVVGGVRLPVQVTRRISRSVEESGLWIAAISLWEIAMLARKGRLQLSMPTLEWMKVAIDRSRVHVAPLEPTIAVDSVELPGTCHGDPADRLIIATARCMDATLVTRDRAIHDYGKARHVRLLQA
ncbi:type II toxin-antitoxin system VapC family toxin [Sorangium sp. So ce131]|uniref:type II toxin-antitoxin system VapC family toxin n=1 Tax=Sorangium sp. So ce131 TaxID=3133282 RepID=UPI003F5DB166